jgi:hypothetical protein
MCTRETEPDETDLAVCAPQATNRERGWWPFCFDRTAKAIGGEKL